LTPEEIRSSPKYSLIRSLFDGTIPFFDVLNTYNLTVTFEDIGSFKGAVYLSRKGNYHIIINESLSPETQRQVFFHEIKHIIEDIPGMPYVIGLDMQRYEFEVSADSYFREVAAAYEGF